MPDRAGKRQKDNQLSEAIRAVTEMPTMDAAVEKVLDVVFVTLQSSPDAEPVNCVARRYLEYLQENQKEETEMICKKVKMYP